MTTPIPRLAGALWSVNIGHDIAGKAAAAVARERSYHPVRDYLDWLKWDGEPRISNWLVTYSALGGQ